MRFDKNSTNDEESREAGNYEKNQAVIQSLETLILKTNKDLSEIGTKTIYENAWRKNMFLSKVHNLLNCRV